MNKGTPQGTLPLSAAASPLPANTQKHILWLVFGVTLLATMGISSLLPALPLLAQAFSITPETSWRIIAAFALPGLVCVPFVGVFADRYGRKAVLVPSLVIFALGGFACAFATSYVQLLLFRMVQGVGSAAFSLLYTTIVADTWKDAERARIMSITAMVLGLGTAFSPALGGALAMIDWRLLFLMPLPALGLAVLAYRLPLFKPDTAASSVKKYMKTCFATVNSRQTIMLLTLTVITFTMLSGPIITCFPIFASSLFHATSLESGLIIAGASFAAGLAACSLPYFYKRYSSKTLMLAAAAAYAAAFICISQAPGLWWTVPGILLYGAGQGLNIPLVATLLTGRTGESERGALMALNGMLLRLGQNIGPATFGTIAAIVGPANAIACGTVLAILLALVASSSPLPAIDRTFPST